jgi:hypothetical protein
VATALEIGTYYVPWLDNLMDTIATPAAVVAGTIITASVVSDTSPFLKWTLAVIAGGGTAVIVQAGTVLVRAASATATGGVGNPLLATAENGGAILGTLLALVLPVVAAILAILLCAWMLRKIFRWFGGRKRAETGAAPAGPAE